MSLVSSHVTVLPFAVWSSHADITDSQHNAKGLALTQAMTQALVASPLPHLSQWLRQSHRTAVDVDPGSDVAPSSLTSPHERAHAMALGWPLVDGGLPWAARTAADLGLHDGSADQAWAHISLCHWQVSNGQVTLADPEVLRIDAATDQALFAAMQGFFAEDGIALHPHKPGHWLAQSPSLAQLRTASLDRVVGRNIDPWLVGGEQPSPAAKLWRRLQNEMQMLLYTHPANEGLRTPINSFWLHGAGVLPALTRSSSLTWDNTLRTPALQHDLLGWLHAWHTVDSQTIAPMLVRAAHGEPQRLVLCGEHEAHVYDSRTTDWWQRMMQRVHPPSLAHALMGQHKGERA